MTLQTISIIVTISLAFIGYIVTYATGIKLESRKERLKFISDQLQYLYGPLYSLRHASGVAWKLFRERCPRGTPCTLFGTQPPPTDEELQAWRLWMNEVFMPLNLKTEKVIIENAHLIEGASMPESFKEFLAHVEIYKVVLKKWSCNDFSEHASSYTTFPEYFEKDVSEAYNNLKQKQATLLGTL
jgi:hypothetical protein